MPLEQRGSSLIFTWGPPWQWRPKLHRSRDLLPYLPTVWSFVWLWFGLWYIRRPAPALLCDAALHAAWEKESAGRRFLFLPHTLDSHTVTVQVTCQFCGYAWEGEAKPHTEKRCTDDTTWN